MALVAISVAAACGPKNAPPDDGYVKVASVRACDDWHNLQHVIVGKNLERNLGRLVRIGDHPPLCWYQQGPDVLALRTGFECTADDRWEFSFDGTNWIAKDMHSAYAICDPA
jgi:hypothetical protein